MKKIIALLLLLLVIYSCERDDICAESTETTPHLVLRFYDFSEQEETLRVIGLQVQGLGDDELEKYFPTASTDSIAIPLRTIDDDAIPENGITTRFKLHKEYGTDDNDTPDDTSDDFETGNSDVISIKYSTEDVYVSKACGYKTIFNNVEIDLESDGDDWIELIKVDEPLIIDNESEAHVQIFH